MPALSRLLQLADTAFPTGAFAHSLGLEAEHAAGGLRDERDLERLLRRHLEGLATGDLVVVRAAHRLAVGTMGSEGSTGAGGLDRHSVDDRDPDGLDRRAVDDRDPDGPDGRAWDDRDPPGLEPRSPGDPGATSSDRLAVDDQGSPSPDPPSTGDRSPTLAALIDLDREIDATRATRETREASRATGERFLIAAVELVDHPVLRALHDAVGAGTTPGTLPVGWGVACAAVGVDAGEAVRAHAFTALSALAAAGQRLVPLGGVATQRALWRAGDAIDAAIATSTTIDPSEPCSFVPELDVRSAQHERQRVRLFIS